MPAAQLSTRQRALALAALLADDQELEPLDRLSPRLAGGARELAAGVLGAEPAERRARLGRLAAELLGAAGPGRPGAAAGRTAGLRRLVSSLEAAPRTGGLPAALRPLGDPLPVLTGLTAALVRRAAAADHRGREVLRRAASLAGAVNPRIAPGLVWVAYALSGDEAAAEALAASWPEGLGRALVEVQADLALDLDEEAVGQERARLEVELAAVG